MNNILCIFRKELILTFRDKRMRFIIFVAPVIQLIIFGYVVTTEVKNIKVILNDYDKSHISREFANSLLSSKYFILSKSNKNNLKKGNTDVIITIREGFSEKIGKGLSSELLISIDGTDANSANIIRGYLEEIINDFSISLLKEKSKIPKGLNFIDTRIILLYNSQLKSSYFMIPGIIVLILLIITSLLTALSITKEKEIGTIEQLIVSPIKRWEFILGKTIPYVFIGFIEVVIILIVARILFELPVRGNIFLLIFSLLIFLFTTLGLGLFGASVSKTQTEAILTIFPIIMPALLLSGFFFPVSSIPIALRWIAYINPLTYALTIVRKILIKGCSFMEIYNEILILIFFGIIFIVFSSLKFRKTIE